MPPILCLTKSVLCQLQQEKQSNSKKPYKALLEKSHDRNFYWLKGEIFFFFLSLRILKTWLGFRAENVSVTCWWTNTLNSNISWIKQLSKQSFPKQWHIRNPQGCGKRVQATDRVSTDKFLLGIQRVFEASVLPFSTSGTVLGRDKSSPAPAPSQAHSWGHHCLTTPGHFLFKHEFIKNIYWNENWPHCRTEEPNFYGFVSIKEL